MIFPSKRRGLVYWGGFTLVGISLAAKLQDVSPLTWTALNKTVDGKLHIGVPIAQPCYLKYDNGTGGNNGLRPDLAACSSIEQQKSSTEYMTSQFGAYTSYNFAPCPVTEEGCALSTFLVDPVEPLLGTCHQGGVPSMYVDAHGVQDIQDTLKFVQETRIPLVIKNTGHDYRGRSAGAGSLAIWTHNIQGTKLDDAFVAEGCSADSASPALSYGAGAQFTALYDVADQHGYFIVGGGSPTVGASGGWVMGGGHSFISPTYGLGVDNVLQMRAVLSNGTYITANRCKNTDLFFALRGGGGGTFAVVTETTSRLHPIKPMQSATILAVSLSPDSKTTFLDIMIQNAEKWAQEGWGGYVGPDIASGLVLIVSLLTPLLTLEEAQASMKPLTDFVLTQQNLHFSVTSQIQTLQSGYKDYVNSTFPRLFNVLNNVGLAPASRLIPKEFFTNKTNQQRLHTTMTQIVNAGEPNALIPFFVLLVPPAAYSLPETDQPGGPGYASVTPAWRNSLWHIFFEKIWSADDYTGGGAGSLSAAYNTSHLAVNPLRQLAPNSGAYQNEADPFEPDYEHAFWGDENYERLLGIKKEVDPLNLLTCYKCVGFDVTDERFKCYPDIA